MLLILIKAKSWSPKKTLTDIYDVISDFQSSKIHGKGELVN